MRHNRRYILERYRLVITPVASGHVCNLCGMGRTIRREAAKKNSDFYQSVNQICGSSFFNVGFRSKK